MGCGNHASFIADHIIPAHTVVEQRGLEAFYDESNIQGLCKRCHDQKTARGE
jgi:5-methylcytosine-specific restriction endonuclease McrA